MDYLAVGIGGFFGSILRYAISNLPINENGEFPVKTLIINVVGSFLIGLIISYSLKDKSIDPRIILLIKVGFCGGFTTFSTFSFETIDLIGNGKYGLAVIYVCLSVLLCLFTTYFASYVVK